ncbi:YeeE/YedE family protein [Massilia sp. BSC265]|uniref:YeeE/YedE family protein n=1 Tax=Massilia sp. BSC265 TaxID=1549812 RepID=UPI0004E964E5|nr:YeeE/YedE thiosulfate transporter family protein [Massilia sp. BSC265]KFI06716.1 YeeE/YedE [Massilia sp. BSC265]
MNIDMASFTPWTSLAGGLLIGAGIALFALLAGRIAGISGIVGGLLRPARGETGWRVAFLAGLVGAPFAFALFMPLPDIRVDAGVPLLLLAGLLVGVGTRYGSGCTSGHGICGLSRRSPRSIAATAAFMAAGFLTVWLLRHVLEVA